ncbi:TrmB family transcriptional regulator [Halostella salina]|uniref:TrmB family transcriptional regulator n=1 Tax=Halostella salina TaxID=1547897 RepID=UPI000EF7EE50|nr:TrmB family transcriptional regulator sugar-binding domain-containing protein [Halostella salina]
MDDSTLRTHLEEFGLSEKEVDTYFACLERGEAKTSTIAEDSGVSQRYVYNIVENLADRGLVRVHDHVVPTKIEARPPEDAIASLVDRLETIESGLAERYNAQETETATFELIKSRQTAIKRIRTTLAEAEEEAFIALPADVIPEVEPALADARDRGVMVLLLAGNVDGASTDGVQTRYAGMASVVREWERDIPFAVTVDAEAGIVGEAALITARHGDEQAVALTQQQIVGSVFGSFFANYWPRGTEVYTDERDALPRTYRLHRPAVLQTVLHDAAGDTVVATVEGTDLDTGDPVTTTGAVVDVRQGLVEPFSNSFIVENSFVIETDEGELSVGGHGAFVEDVQADEVTLELA